MVVQKSLPVVRLCLVVLSDSPLKIMADRCRQTVSGVQVAGDFAKLQQAHEHLGDLFLRGIPIACDGLLYLFRSVFLHRDISVQRSGYSNPLCATQFEHGLYIFSKKGCLNGHFVWLVTDDELVDAFKDALQLVRLSSVLAQVQHSVVDEAQLPAYNVYQAVSHDDGARIDSQYDLICLFQ